MISKATILADTLPTTFDLPAIDDFLSAQVIPSERVGLSVAIVREGRVVLARGYGRASLDRPVPVDAHTRFAIGSVTKQFTCACILLLAEEGKLSVSDTVSKYFPSLTQASEITLLDLMNHVSGYPDYYPLDFVDRRMRQPIEPDELLRRYATGKLDFDPGSRWSYSNTGYILLGRVVEKASGEAFGAFLARKILRPLGMEETIYEPDAAATHVAVGFTTFALSEPEPGQPEARGWIGAAGGLFSTPGDLAKWDLALMEGRILKPESYRLMTSARTLRDGRTSDYGCGLGVRTQGGREVLSHNGAVSGFTASNALIPSTRSAVVLMCNQDGGLGSLPAQILSLLLKESSGVPVVSKGAAVETVKRLFAALQQGKVDRREFSEDFNDYLTDARLEGASRRLQRLGTPSGAEVVNTYERGGMEVTVTRLSFKDEALRALMYRMPDGRIEQFFVGKE